MGFKLWPLPSQLMSFVLYGCPDWPLRIQALVTPTTKNKFCSRTGANCGLLMDKANLLMVSSEATAPGCQILLMESQEMFPSSSPTVNYGLQWRAVHEIICSYNMINSLFINPFSFYQNCSCKYAINFLGAALSSTLLCSTSLRDRRYQD